MIRFSWLIVGLLVIALNAPRLAAQPETTPVLIYVTVPADSVLEVDGVPVRQTGAERRLITPAIKYGTSATYTLSAKFTRDGEKVVVTKTITVTAGAISKIDLSQAPVSEPKKLEPKPEIKKPEPKPEPKKVEPEPKKVEPKKLVTPKLDVPYVPTPQTVVDQMLKMAGVKEGDVVYDLGCGDGRIVVTAVKDFRAKRGVGVDLDPVRIKESKANAKTAGVESKVEFREGDVLKLTDVSEANVVTLYLFPEVNEKLQPMLQKSLKPGSRVVSHDFLMQDNWRPDKTVEFIDGAGTSHSIYLWTIPAKK